jgi:TonB family protein
MRRGLSLLFLSFSLAAAVHSACSAAPAPVTKRPDWAETPSGADLSANFPPIAKELGMEGRTVIVCDVGVTGSLKNCKVAEETPKEMGFGAAALRLSAAFRMTPMMRDGKAIESDVRIPLTFRIPSLHTETPPSAGSEQALSAARAVVEASPNYIPRSMAEDDRQIAAIERSPPSDTPTKTVEAYLQVRKSTRDDDRAAVGEASAQALASLFSEAQLHEILRFFQGPGRDALQRTGDVGAEYSQLSRDNNLLVRFRQRQTFCAKIACDPSPATLQQLAAVLQGAALQNPDWLEQPDKRQLASSTPVWAQRFGVSGAAILLCQAGDVGLLKDCLVAGETVSGMGFGAAALRLAKYYRFDLEKAHKKGGAVAVSVVFDVDTPVTPPEPSPAPADRMALATQILQAGDFSGDALQSWQRVLDQSPADREIDVDPNVRAIAEQAWIDGVKAAVPAAAERNAITVANTATREQLTAALAFSKSPAGKLYLRSNEIIDKRIAAYLDPLRAKLLEKRRQLFCQIRECAVSGDQLRAVLGGSRPPT